MNGAEALLHTAREAGLDVCFSNPGTTEMPLVQALDAVGGFRAVLGLFEGVCTGAADGYGRMTGRPALTLLHLGPGLANGLANLHNARRARTPVVTIVGDHATDHVVLDAPLTSDIESLARPVSGWVRTTKRPADVADDTAAAIAAARTGMVATLVMPADCQWEPADGPKGPTALPAPDAPAEERIAHAAETIVGRRDGVLLLGGSALGVEAQRTAAAIGAATGWTVLAETFPARMQRGQGAPPIARLPYFPEQAEEALAGDAVLLAGVREPVAFFAYPGRGGRLVRPGVSEILASPDEDAATALRLLAERLGVDSDEATPPADEPAPQVPPDAALELGNLGLVVAAAQPEGAVVVDESVTSGLAYFDAAAGAMPHDYLALTGGSIGYGLPAAVGAAIACPERKVIAFQADGSAMYTLQALWTMAREQLDVTVVLCANRSYKILELELLRAGATEFGPAARGLTDLSDPVLDWVALAKGMGVPASSARTTTELADALGRAITEPGPALVEAVLA